MSCGGTGKYSGAEFDKLFASRFNELDSLVSSDSSPIWPEPVQVKKTSACAPCGALTMPSAGSSQSLLQWILFFLLIVGILFLLMYIFKRLCKTRHNKNVFGAMLLPSVGQKSAGGTVETPPLAMQGAAKTPMGEGASGRVKVVTDPADMLPSDDSKVHIIMFFATWCGHCTAMKPQFLELSDAHTDAVFCLVENTVLQKHPQAESLGIKGFPHVAAFLGKKQLGQHVGNQGKDKLEEFIKKMKAMRQM
jgi:thiol-disulfide isomerase/thioredoxin